MDAKTDRKEEIAATLSTIQMLCLSSKMALIAKPVMGVVCVVIKDHTDGKEYVITRDKGGRGSER